MALRKMGNVWVFRCKVNGKTWTRSTGETDKRKALAKLPVLEAEAQLHREQPVQSVRLSRAIVAEVARIEEDVSERQAERNSTIFQTFLKWVGRDIELRKIDTDMLERYQRERLRTKAGSTVKQEIHAIGRMLRENKLNVEKPKSKAGRKTEAREFTEEELDRFFKACSEDHKTLFSCLLATGARSAEVIPSVRSSHTALLKRELDAEACCIHLRTAKLKPNQKSKVRVIKVSKELMDRLIKLSKRTKGPHVFQINQSLAHLFDRILGRAEIPKHDELGHKLTAHSFRHTYASLAAKQVHYNPHVLKDILGHCSLTTTDRYIHTRSQAEVVDLSGFLESKTEEESEEESQVGARSGGKTRKKPLAGSG